MVLHKSQEQCRDVYKQALELFVCTACIKMIGAVWKLITFTSMVNRTINTSSNEIIIAQVYDTCLQMFDVCTLGRTAHIKSIVQFQPHSDQHVRCDGLALFHLQRHPRCLKLLIPASNAIGRGGGSLLNCSRNGR